MSRFEALYQLVQKRLADSFARYPLSDVRSPVALFDWDNTCIDGDCSEAFLEYLVREEQMAAERSEVFCRIDPELDWTKLSPLEAYQACHQNPQVARRDLYATFPLLFTGQSEEEMRKAYFDIFMKSDLAPRRRQAIYELQQAFSLDGILNVIVSASPSYMVKLCAMALNVDMAAEHIHGLSHGLDVDGRYRDGLDAEAPITYGPGKVEVILKHYPEATPVISFGDADTDFDLLTYEREFPAVKVFLGEIDQHQNIARYVSSLDEEKRTQWLIRGVDFD